MEEVVHWLWPVCTSSKCSSASYFNSYMLCIAFFDFYNGLSFDYQVFSRAVIFRGSRCWLVCRFCSLVSALRYSSTFSRWIIWCWTGDWFQIPGWKLYVPCGIEEAKIYKGNEFIQLWIICFSKLLDISILCCWLTLV